MTTRIDMDDELTYSRTEQQLRQLALSRAHKLLEYEVIWGQTDILVIASLWHKPHKLTPGILVFLGY